MSSVASAPARGDVGDVDDYDEMLDILDRLLDESLRKVESGRVYDAENERVRRNLPKNASPATTSWARGPTSAATSRRI